MCKSSDKGRSTSLASTGERPVGLQWWGGVEAGGCCVRWEVMWQGSGWGMVKREREMMCLVCICSIELVRLVELGKGIAVDGEIRDAPKFLA